MGNIRDFRDPCRSVIAMATDALDALVHDLAEDQQLIDDVVGAARADFPEVARLPWAESRRHVAALMAAACGAAIGALVYAVAREGIAVAGWDSSWFQALLGVLLLVALLANGVVRSRLRAAPRS